MGKNSLSQGVNSTVENTSSENVHGSLGMASDSVSIPSTSNVPTTPPELPAMIDPQELPTNAVAPVAANFVMSTAESGCEQVRQESEDKLDTDFASFHDTSQF